MNGIIEFQRNPMHYQRRIHAPLQRNMQNVKKQYEDMVRRAAEMIE